MNEQELRTSLHESGHVVACLLLKLPVTAVTRQSEYPDAYGYTTIPGFEEGMDRDRARRIALMCLCGPIMGSQAVPTWRPSRDAPGTDEPILAALVDYLRYTESDYLQLTSDAFRLSASDEFVRLFEAVSGLLERMPSLDEEGLRIAQEIGGPCEPG